MELRFSNPVNVIVGEGSVKANAAKFSELGDVCLIVTDKNSATLSGAMDDVSAVLKEQGVRYEVFDDIGQNPLITDVEKAADKAKEMGAKYILGIGGGSCIDAAKACALLAANDIHPVTEVFKRNWKNPSLPIIVIGTTSGTGTEVTPFAVVTEPENGVKLSIWTPWNFPKYAFGDPKYTMTVPMNFTISTGLDALSHCIDAYYLKGDVLSDTFAIEGIKMVLKNFKGIDKKDIKDITLEERAELYIASIYGGYAIARAGTAWTHSFSYHLTENFGVPHGVAVALFLPSYLEEGEKYAAEKSKKLYDAIGCTRQELSDFIVNLCKVDLPKISDEEIALWVKKQEGKGTLKNSPIGGIDEKMTEELIRKAIGQ